jgi:hypothetical protein
MPLCLENKAFSLDARRDAASPGEAHGETRYIASVRDFAPVPEYLYSQIRLIFWGYASGSNTSQTGHP